MRMCYLAVVCPQQPRLVAVTAAIRKQSTLAGSHRITSCVLEPTSHPNYNAAPSTPHASGNKLSILNELIFFSPKTASMPKLFMRYKRSIIWPLLIVLAATRIPMAVNLLHHARVTRRTEAHFHKLVESNSESVFTWYPELIDRISADRHTADRIKFVHLSYVEDDDGYSSLKNLTNVEEIEITYSHHLRSVIPTINRMPSLKRAMFAYCGPTEKWLSQLKHPTLEVLEIHDYQAIILSADSVRLCKDNIPSCAIKVSDDDEQH